MLQWCKKKIGSFGEVLKVIEPPTHTYTRLWIEPSPYQPSNRLRKHGFAFLSYWGLSYGVTFRALFTCVMIGKLVARLLGSWNCALPSARLRPVSPFSFTTRVQLPALKGPLVTSSVFGSSSPMKIIGPCTSRDRIWGIIHCPIPVGQRHSMSKISGL